MFTNLQLIERWKKILKEDWRYLYGGTGQVLTEAGAKAAMESAYYKNKSNKKDVLKGVGKRVCDCMGGSESLYMDAGYDNKYDRQTDATYAAAKVKGDMTTFPWGTPGIQLYRKGHVEISDGDGYLYGINATGSPAYHKKINREDWIGWFEHPDFLYVKPEVVFGVVSLFVCCATKMMNVRSGPSTAYPVLRTINNGTFVVATHRCAPPEGSTIPWYKGADGGYYSGLYLKPVVTITGNGLPLVTN